MNTESFSSESDGAAAHCIDTITNTDINTEIKTQEDAKAPPEEDETDANTLMKTTLIAKYGKETITIPDLPSQSTTISTVKNMILEQTNILPKRQKFVGLSMMEETATVPKKGDNLKRRKKAIDDDECTLDKLHIKKPKDCVFDSNGELIHTYHSFILMGTPESEIFIDPDSTMHDGRNNVVNDFDLDFNIGSSEWKEHFVNHQNLVKFTNSTEVHIMNPPREGKKLMVLDLDHTLLDFSSKKIVNTANAARYGDGNNNTTGDNDVSSAAAVAPIPTVQETINQMKRPYMDEFLTEMYQYYDLVVWSQTSWRWLETKLVELGMLTNPNYR